MADFDEGLAIGLVLTRGRIGLKEIDRVIHSIDTDGNFTNSVEVDFADENVYEMVCERTETSSQIVLTDIKEYWNGELIEYEDT